MINTVGPVWEGNQVWLILGGGAIFAAWPPLYAVAFSGFYLAMLLVLAGADPAAGRLQVPQQDRRIRAGGRSGTGRCSSAASCRRWCSASRSAMCSRACRSASTTPCASPTRAVSRAAQSLRAVVRPGQRRDARHAGAAWLAVKTEGRCKRARKAVAAIAALAAASSLFIAGWRSGPLSSTAMRFVHAPATRRAIQSVDEGMVDCAPGALLGNYRTDAAGRSWRRRLASWRRAGCGVAVLARRAAPALAFVSQRRLPIAGVIATAGMSLFPFLLPSSPIRMSSLTVWDASSSQTTLGIMTRGDRHPPAVVLAYTGWVYRVLRGPVTADAITQGPPFAFIRELRSCGISAGSSAWASPAPSRR